MPNEGPVDCMQGKTIMMFPLVDILCPGHGKGVYMCVHICVCVHAYKVSPALVEVPSHLVLTLDSLQSNAKSLPHLCL